MTLAAGTSTGNFRRSRGGIERPFVSLPLLFGLVILLIKHFYFPFPPVFRIFLQFLLSLTLVTHTDNHWTPGHSVKIKFTDFAASDFFANTGPPKELSVTQWYIVSCTRSGSQVLDDGNLVHPSERSSVEAGKYYSLERFRPFCGCGDCPLS